MAPRNAIADARGHTQTESWRRPTAAELWQHPLPCLGAGDRALLRAANYCLLHRITDIHGLEHVASSADPCIVALNHTTRIEALAIPALLAYSRQGRRIHFLADWNFQMIPGFGLLYRRAGAIVVSRKAAKPRFLNVLKPLYTPDQPPLVQARAHLEAGRSIGIFPEGTVNRDPARLLRGRLGAARLSLEASVPVIPGGIRISGGTPERPLIEVQFAAPLQPPPRTGQLVTSRDVRGWHAVIMAEIARLSGKSWEQSPQEPRHDTA